MWTIQTEESLCQKLWLRDIFLLVERDRCMFSSGQCPLMLDGLNDFCHNMPHKINTSPSWLTHHHSAVYRFVFHSWLSGELQSPRRVELRLIAHWKGRCWWIIIFIFTQHRFHSVTMSGMNSAAKSERGFRVVNVCASTYLNLNVTKVKHWCRPLARIARVFIVFKCKI